MRAWSHTNMYAPGARITPALSGEKNPASVFKCRTYYYVFGRCLVAWH